MEIERVIIQTYIHIFFVYQMDVINLINLLNVKVISSILCF